MSWIQIALVGRASERDAIGAEVVVSAGEQSWTAWQTGGDGLMATNQQILHFGLGQVDLVDAVEIRWPSGRTQTFEGIEVNHRFLVIEDDGEIFSLNSRDVQ